MAKNFQDNLAIVLAGGGLGKRVGIPTPKPLIVFDGVNRTPLSSILDGIPKEIPIFIYALAEQRSEYERYLSENDSFGHNVRYLVQQSTPAYWADGDRITFPNGDPVTVSNGMATFAREMCKYALPEYVFFMDGNLTGINFDDVRKAIDTIGSLDALVLVRELTGDELEKEAERRSKQREGKNVHPVYTRTPRDGSVLYEGPRVPDRYLTDGNWLAFTGMNLYRTSALLEKSKGWEGDEIRIFNGLGKAFQIRTNMLLRRYNGRPQGGLDLGLHVVEEYFPGIKEPSDLMPRDIQRIRLEMPHLILGVGVVGSGKTTILEAVARHVSDAFVVKKDTLNDSFLSARDPSETGVGAYRLSGESISRTSDYYQEFVRLQSYRAMLELARDNLRNGKHPILEGCYSKEIPEGYLDDVVVPFFGGLTYRMKLIVCHADEKTLFRRILERGLDRDASKLSPDGWNEWLRERPIIPPNIERYDHIKVDTAKPLEQNVEEVMRYLSS